MALPKWYIEIKASSNVRDPLGQGWSDDGNVVELQHFSGMHCSGRELWSHPLQGATSAFGALGPKRTMSGTLTPKSTDDNFLRIMTKNTSNINIASVFFLSR